MNLGIQLNDINGGSFRVYAMKDVGDVKKFSTQPNRDVCQFRIDSKNKEIGLRATVSYVLYYLDKYMNNEIVSKCGPGWDKTAENYFNDLKVPRLSSNLYDHLMDTNPGLNVVSE